MAALLLPMTLAAQVRPVRAPAAPAPLPQLHLVEDLRINGADEGLEGGLFQMLLILPRGRIVYGEPSHFRVTFFEADGTRLGQFGKCGDDPGGFAAVGSQRGPRAQFGGGTLADTVWLYDWFADRVTFVTSEGEFLRTKAVNDHPRNTMSSQYCNPPGFLRRLLEGPPLPAPPRTPAPVSLPDVSLRSFQSREPEAAYGNGSILWRETHGTSYPSVAFDGGETRSSRTDSVRFVRTTPSGDSARVIAAVPSNPARVAESGVVSSAPLADLPRYAIAQDGSRIAVLTARSTSATGGVLTLTVINAKGDTTLVRQYPATGVRVDPERADALSAQIVRNVNDGITRLDPKQSEEFRRRLRAAVPVSKMDASVQLGVDSTVWIRRAHEPGGVQWLVLDEKGAAVGVLPSTPQLAGSLMRMTRFKVWMVERGKAGVPSIVRYRIEPNR
jgi:hypothetical protein